VHRVVAVAFPQIGGGGQRADQNESRQHVGTPPPRGRIDRPTANEITADVTFGCERCFREIVSNGPLLLRSWGRALAAMPRQGRQFAASAELAASPN
jgi:hypothetical protein